MNFKKNKYNAKKTYVDGIKFDSKAEAEYYTLLLYKQKIGELKILELQPKVYLTQSKILYKPDFLIKEGRDRYYVDVKGPETPVFRIKMRLWVHYGQGKLKLVKKRNRAFQVYKTICTEKPKPAK